MKHIVVDCDYCERSIQPSHQFTRHKNVFYHALCFELYVIECVEKVRQQAQNGQ